MIVVGAQFWSQEMLQRKVCELSKLVHLIFALIRYKATHAALDQKYLS